jgi:hypothetical protein
LKAAGRHNKPLETLFEMEEHLPQAKANLAFSNPFAALRAAKGLVRNNFCPLAYIFCARNYFFEKNT